ncbi:MAG: protoporphyrinogen oxidase [Bacillota bacterium]|nr:MAG: protoporphyrinogen oxidase [Bacillota bacterium]
MTADPRIAVVGAGIAGLAAALRLLDSARAGGRPLSLTILEADARPGGKVRTERAGGLVIEQGPDSMVAQKPWGIGLARRVGLDGDLIGPGPQAGRTYIVHGGRLVPMPEGLALGVPLSATALWRSPLFSLAGKLRASLEPLVPPRREAGDESMASFLRRRLGREVADRLVAPLLAGISSGDPERLSIEATFPELRRMERQHGSLVRGMRARRRGRAAPGGDGLADKAREGRRPFVNLRGGLDRLPAAVAAELQAAPGVRLVTGARVRGVEPRDGDRYDVILEDGARETYDAVVLAVPAWEAAGLIASFAPEAAGHLLDIPYKSSVVVALAFPERATGKLEGSGFIVPAGEGRFITACTWVSAKWPGTAPEGTSLLRCFAGRPGQEPVDLADDEILDAVLADLRDLMGIEERPTLARIYRWRRAMPQYEVGHLDRVAAITAHLQDHPRLVLAGAGYGGAGVPDCIRQGEEAAGRVWTALRRP